MCEGENRIMKPIPLSALPTGVREGDCLRLDGVGYVIDNDETARRRALNKSLFEQLKRQKPH